MDIKDLKSGLTIENFWFQGKMNLIQNLLKISNSPKEANILNIGVGTGDDLKIINKFGKVFVLDKDQEALNMIPNNLVFEKNLGDAVALPCANNFFDIVLLF